jgi:hypothetical protein
LRECRPFFSSVFQVPQGGVRVTLRLFKSCASEELRQPPSGDGLSLAYIFNAFKRFEIFFFELQN